MSAAIAVAPDTPKRRVPAFELWGRLLVLPYLAVFLVFVVYPLGYGLWLARHPASYVKLFDDPISTVVSIPISKSRKLSRSDSSTACSLR